jgi:DNA polymerase
MRVLGIDIETYSSIDLTKSGVYAYSSAPDFKILLFAYAYDDDDEEVKIYDPDTEGLPPSVLGDLTDPDVIKTAFNAEFEITCIQRAFGIELDPAQWRCTMIQAAELGLPQSLAQVAQVLGLPAQKDKRGRKCIDFFSKPCKRLKDAPLLEDDMRHKPEDDPELWAAFREYCKQDVEVERAIRRRLADFPIAESEQRLWVLDKAIAARGCRIDEQLARNAVRFGERFTAEKTAELVRLTGLDNPNSVSQLKAWLTERTGQTFDSLDKKAVKAILKDSTDPLVKEVLRLRAEVAKTSTKKYGAMLECTCPDERARGFLRFYGAARTGRWAGALVQVQNLPQNHLPDLAEARELVRSGDYELFEMCYGSVQQTLSELIRTAFVPSPGCRFIVSDFSAIEARVVAYLAGEKWRLEVFGNGGDIYCASASKMFGVPVVKHGVNGHLRQKGKIAELALGYGGSVGALISMGALEMGLTEDELQPLVDSWRQSNPRIVQFWYDVQSAAMKAAEGEPQRVGRFGFFRKSGILFVRLPSGRCIAYVQPKITENRFGKPALTYMGLDQQTKAWTRLETFGGKLTENLVQAVARDCLAESMIRLEQRGYRIVFHVHDEVIIDAPKGFGSAEEVAAIMGEPISWAPGLPLRAEGYETEFYRKD